VTLILISIGKRTIYLGDGKSFGDNAGDDRDNEMFGGGGNMNECPSAAMYGRVFHTHNKCVPFFSSFVFFCTGLTFLFKPTRSRRLFTGRALTE